MKAILALFCLFVSVQSIQIAIEGAKVQDQPQWTLCSGDAGHIKVSTFDMKPYPAVAGQNLTSIVTGTVNSDISGGTWNLSIKKGFIPVLSKSGNTCDLVVKCSPKNQCPCSSGDFTASLTITVPSIAFPGSYNGVLEAKDQTGNRLVCLNVVFNIGS
eukprot:TRINITY_DN552_c0_g2_i1.p1 TRINITY_DN552_c0_g2~~TRINITY_DN552_c0_g2_i1.p1  ORF type:complete len:158 (-),score=64.64 TRINITY_DN552_c0_g2_i1:105-578(-)